jgi:hypothetical protein
MSKNSIIFYQSISLSMNFFRIVLGSKLMFCSIWSYNYSISTIWCSMYFIDLSFSLIIFTMSFCYEVTFHLIPFFKLYNFSNLVHNVSKNTWLYPFLKSCMTCRTRTKFFGQQFPLTSGTQYKYDTIKYFSI